MRKLNSIQEIEEFIKNNKIVLLYFGGKNCGVCTIMKPKIEEVLLRYPKVKAVQMDVEEALEITARYSMFTIPGILLFIEGKESIREARHISIQDLEMRISRYYELVYN